MDFDDYMRKLAANSEECRKARQAYLASPEYKALQESLGKIFESLKAIYDDGDFDTLLESEKFFLKDALDRANSPEEVEDLESERLELDGQSMPWGWSATTRMPIGPW